VPCDDDALAKRVVLRATCSTATGDVREC
jgi:hypothetical protein